MRDPICSRCGCVRAITAIAKIRVGKTTLSYKRLCIPCILTVNGLLNGEKFNYEGAIETMEEAEKRWSGE